MSDDNRLATAMAAATEAMTEAINHTSNNRRPPAPSGADRDRELAQQNDLEILALVHDAWVRQMQTRRGITFQVSARDIHILQLMLQALDQTPRPGGDK